MIAHFTISYANQFGIAGNEHYPLYDWRPALRQARSGFIECRGHQRPGIVSFALVVS